MWNWNTLQNILNAVALVTVVSAVIGWWFTNSLSLLGLCVAVFYFILLVGYFCVPWRYKTWPVSSDPDKDHPRRLLLALHRVVLIYMFVSLVGCLFVDSVRTTLPSALEKWVGATLEEAARSGKFKSDLVTVDATTFNLRPANSYAGQVVTGKAHLVPTNVAIAQLLDPLNVVPPILAGLSLLVLVWLVGLRLAEVIWQAKAGP